VKWFPAAAFLTTVLLANGAGATFKDANKLLEECQAENLICAGYLQGVADAVANLQHHSAIGRIACVPKNVTVRQMKDVVVQYLVANAKDRHNSAANQVMFALKQAWPCLN
jgi:hypothetical protein